MYRSGSSTRVSDEFFSSPSPPDAEQQQQQQQLLPTYNPESHLAKKDRLRLRSAEAAVHLIPIMLIICAVILWFFSAPGLLIYSCFIDRCRFLDWLIGSEMISAWNWILDLLSLTEAIEIHYWGFQVIYSPDFDLRIFFLFCMMINFEEDGYLCIQQQFSHRSSPLLTRGYSDLSCGFWGMEVD